MSVRLSPAWRDYRKRRRVLAATVATVPLLAALVPSLGRAFESGHALRHALLASWATAVVAAVVWFAAFRCPYCTRPFHWTWIVADPLSRECLHCGFERWRDPHAARRFGPR